jgi:hypothetical protein
MSRGLNLQPFNGNGDAQIYLKNYPRDEKEINNQSINQSINFII